MRNTGRTVEQQPSVVRLVPCASYIQHSYMRIGLKAQNSSKLLQCYIVSLDRTLDQDRSCRQLWQCSGYCCCLEAWHIRSIPTQQIAILVHYLSVKLSSLHLYSLFPLISSSDSSL